MSRVRSFVTGARVVVDDVDRLAVVGHGQAARARSGGDGLDPARAQVELRHPPGHVQRRVDLLAGRVDLERPRAGADRDRRRLPRVEVDADEVVAAHDPDVGGVPVRRDGDAPRVPAHRDPPHLAAGPGRDDAEIPGAPVGDEHEAAVRRHGDDLRHRAHAVGVVDLERLERDPVDEAPVVARRGRALVVSLGPEAVAVHGVVGDVGVLRRPARRRPRPARPASSPGSGRSRSRPARPSRRSSSGARASARVVDRDRVPVHHVLGEDQPGPDEATDFGVMSPPSVSRRRSVVRLDGFSGLRGLVLPRLPSPLRRRPRSRARPGEAARDSSGSGRPGAGEDADEDEPATTAAVSRRRRICRRLVSRRLIRGSRSLKALGGV